MKMENSTSDPSIQLEEELFRKAFEEGPLGMAIVGLDYRFLKVNPNFCRMLGYSCQELAQLTFPDITHPEDVNTDLELARKLFAGEIPNYRIVKRYLRKDGDIIWINLSASVIRDENGQALYGLAMIEDITERRRMEEELLISEERFRTFAGVIDAVAWIAEPCPERILFVGNTFADIWGRPVSEFYSNPRVWMDSIHEEDRKRVRRCFEEFLKGDKKEYRAEFRIVRPDGAIRWIADHGVKMQIGAGKLEICGIAVDITKRKKSEQAVAEAESILQALFDNAPLPMLISEGDTEKVVKINGSFREVIGYSLEEMPDVSHWWPLAYPDPEYRNQIRELWNQKMSRSIQYGTAVEPVEAQIRCSNGETRIFECHAASIQSRHLIIFVDLTELRRLEVQLREAEIRFRSAFEYAATGMALLSGTGQFLQVNRAFCDMLGYSEEEMLSRDFQGLTFHDDLDKGLELWQELLDGRRDLYTLEKRYLHKSGRPVWGMLSGSVVRNAQGEVLYFIA